jgi:hypothetical protein
MTPIIGTAFGAIGIMVAVGVVVQAVQEVDVDGRARHAVGAMLPDEADAADGGREVVNPLGTEAHQLTHSDVEEVGLLEPRAGNLRVFATDGDDVVVAPADEVFDEMAADISAGTANDYFILHSVEN